MKNIISFFLVLTSFSLRAQYYYNDIVGTAETDQQMKTYITNKVTRATASGYDARGVKTNDYAEVQEVKENGRALKISTHNNSTLSIFYDRFDEQGRLVSIIDSSSDLQSITTYDYDPNGKISQVKNTIKDTANNFDQTEVHKWIYNSSGRPERMWRIINNHDSLELRFTVDEEGNTADERTFRHGVESDVVYYYYDDKKRLTDIVRYNTRAKKLLPDIMFEYDNKDRIIQKLTTTSSLNLNYLIWRYLFDDKGLKTKEALFNNDKELTGKIEYSYTFGQ